jgi:hypothetical protein
MFVAFNAVTFSVQLHFKVHVVIVALLVMLTMVTDTLLQAHVEFRQFALVPLVLFEEFPLP